MNTKNEDIEGLKDLINVIQNNVHNSINLLASVIAVAIAIAGTALYFLARTWVEKRVSDELKIIRANLVEEMSRYKNELKLEISKRPQFLWAKGVIWVPPTNQVHLTGIDLRSDFVGLDFPNKLEVRGQKSNRILSYEAEIKPNKVLVINLNDLDREQDGNQIIWNIIWLNPEFLQVTQ